MMVSVCPEHQIEKEHKNDDDVLDIFWVRNHINNVYQCIISKDVTYKPVHEISNNVVCATSKAADQPAHTRSLIRAFASRLNIL